MPSRSRALPHSSKVLRIHPRVLWIRPKALRIHPNVLRIRPKVFYFCRNVNFLIVLFFGGVSGGKHVNKTRKDSKKMGGIHGQYPESTRILNSKAQLHLGNPCMANVKYTSHPSGALRGSILGLPGLRSESSWSSRASQFWLDLAAKTPQHQAPQARQESAAGAQPLTFLLLEDVSRALVCFSFSCVIRPLFPSLFAVS